MSAARPLFPRKRKAIRDLAMSCHEETSRLPSPFTIDAQMRDTFGVSIGKEAIPPQPFLWNAAVVSEGQKPSLGTGFFEEPHILGDDGEFGWGKAFPLGPACRTWHPP